MNTVCIIGNAASDPELRHTEGGRAVCTLRVAVSRPGKQEADFFTVVAWERQAEVVNEYVQKGRRVAVEGRLHHRTWETNNNEKRSTVEIVAHRVELLSPRESGEDQAGEPVGAGVGDEGSPFG